MKKRGVKANSRLYSDNLSKIFPKSNRSQAGIITIVLIILMVLVAIVVVWNIVYFTIKGSSEQISVNQFALKGEIKYYLSKIENQNDAINVSVHRGSGGGNITGVKLIFEFTGETTRSYENRIDYPKELETKVYTITGGMLNPATPPILNFLTLKKVSVHYIFSENNKDKFTMELDSADGPSAGSVSGTVNLPATTCTIATQAVDCIAQADACNDGVCVSGNCAKSPKANGLACDDGNACTSGTTCSSGSCTGGTGCGSQTCCTSVCKNTQTDNNNCGGCGIVCPIENPNCISGVCSATIGNCRVATDNPMQICTLQDLDEVRGNLNANYILMNDIDASSVMFNPIGSDSSMFMGNFDGKGHVIDNLIITKTNDYVGLFGFISGGNVINLKITNARVTGGVSLGYVGGLAGKTNNGNIINCSFSGNVTGNSGGYIGGLIGYAYNSIIQKSYSSGNVKALSPYISNVGGLIGVYYVNDGSTNKNISDCYSTSNVTATDVAISNVGGFAGANGYTNKIYNSYATGNVTTGEWANNVGGFVGNNVFVVGGSRICLGSCLPTPIYNSYSTGKIVNGSLSTDIGGFVGLIDINSGSLNNCYWLNVAGNPSNCYAGGSSGDGGGCTQMSSQSWFYNPANAPMSGKWDFTKIWNSNNPNGYPTLK